MPEPTVPLTPLQTRVAREIISVARRENRRVGDPMPELLLAEKIGTSRTPVQVAMRYLAGIGVVRQDANRRFFMAKNADELGGMAEALGAKPDDPLYLDIAQARLSGTLPDEVNESELMRRFDVARSTLRKVLSRIANEGWAEQRVGSGWLFLPMINSPEAYEESYLFRQSIEPAGLLSSSFQSDPAKLLEIRREQEHIVAGGFETMTAIELFEANSRFHETLALWSGNRFIAQSVRRMDQLRRLVEYSQAANRPARSTQAREHLAILDAVAKQDLVGAAGLMRSHLEDARRAKVFGAGDIVVRKASS